MLAKQRNVDKKSLIIREMAREHGVPRRALHDRVKKRRQARSSMEPVNNVLDRGTRGSHVVLDRLIGRLDYATHRLG